MYKPLRDIILLTLDKEEAEKKTSSGIFLGKDVWNETKSSATVEAVGSEVTAFKKGDRVVVNPYAILDIQGEKDLKFIKECDILAYV